MLVDGWLQTDHAAVHTTIEMETKREEKSSSISQTITVRDAAVAFVVVVDGVVWRESLEKRRFVRWE